MVFLRHNFTGAVDLEQVGNSEPVTVRQVKLGFSHCCRQGLVHVYVDDANVSQRGNDGFYI